MTPGIRVSFGLGSGLGRESLGFGAHWWCGWVSFSVGFFLLSRRKDCSLAAQPAKARPLAVAAAGHHAFQKVRGDWESCPGELRATVWKTGRDRGRYRPEQGTNRCSRHGENLHQLQASVAYRYHYFYLQESEEEGPCQGRGGG